VTSTLTLAIVSGGIAAQQQNATKHVDGFSHEGNSEAIGALVTSESMMATPKSMASIATTGKIISLGHMSHDPDARHIQIAHACAQPRPPTMQPATAAINVPHAIYDTQQHLKKGQGR